MSYVATPEDRQKVRWEIQDVSTGLYILDDDTITYFLEKNNGSVARASIDAAKTILFKLSIESTDEVVSILSLKGSKAAEQYRLALELYLKSPSLNPLYQNATLWAGNISKSEILENNSTCDNNIPSLASQDLNPTCYDTNSNPFTI